MIKKRVAILISGRGSNMQSLIAACAAPDYPATIVGVISNKAEAQGLVFAAAHNIPAVTVAHKNFETRCGHDAAMHETLLKMAPDIIACAGYMRIMTPTFVEKWQGRMINIHPSLLPDFKGTRTHERALEAGAKIHGCSVHFVTAGMDEGPVILQSSVPVLSDDTPDTLRARVLVQEHLVYPKALRIICEDVRFPT